MWCSRPTTASPPTPPRTPRRPRLCHQRSSPLQQAPWGARTGSISPLRARATHGKVSPPVRPPVDAAPVATSHRFWRGARPGVGRDLRRAGHMFRMADKMAKARDVWRPRQLLTTCLKTDKFEGGARIRLSRLVELKKVCYSADYEIVLLNPHEIP